MLKTLKQIIISAILLTTVACSGSRSSGNYVEAYEYESNHQYQDSGFDYYGGWQ